MRIRQGSIAPLMMLLCLHSIQAQVSPSDVPADSRPRVPTRLGDASRGDDGARDKASMEAQGVSAGSPKPTPIGVPAATAVPSPPQPWGRAPGADEHAPESVIELMVGRGRILTVPSAITKQGDVGVIAIGDPTVADFEVLPNPRLLRIVGKRPGVTDLTLVTATDESLVYELRVQYDLTLLEARLRQSFPDALVKISQIGHHLILEGQARDQRQSTLIEDAVRVFLDSMNTSTSGRGRGSAGTASTLTPEDLGIQRETESPDYEMQATSEGDLILRALPEMTVRSQFSSTTAPQIINLMKLPGVQQVMLQVRIAELNRTALREIGADTFFKSGPGNIVGTSIAGATPPILQGMTDGMNGMDGLNGMMNAIGPDLGPNSTAFGIFPKVRMDIIIRALRENAVLRVLAEPNLVALSGHEASFLAGGEFPVPVAQGGALGAGNITVQYKEFGVQLNFVPYILDDEVIRLEVRPEVSSIDDRLGTTLVVGGDPTPGVNTRRVHTTVQMREGETLALAGLLLVNLEASTSRIPGLGDLPYIGPLFSNTSHFKQEKELLVLVTPYLVSPMDSCDAPPLPGAEIQDPNDLEFYFLNRIEGRTGQGFRSTTAWQDPYHLVRLLKLERDHICGPAGFSSYPVQVSESK